MAWLSRTLAGLRGLFQKTRQERELDAELREFVESSVEEKVRSGMTRAEATRIARLELGSVEAVKDRVRDVGWESVVEHTGRDLRYAVRSLRKSPGFTTAAVLTLALGIGATTAIFSLFDAVLLKSLPVERPEELVRVGGSQYPVFQAFRRRTDIFVDLAATSGVQELDVEGQSGVQERAEVSLVSGSYFSTLGIRPAIGRFFTADDDRVPGEHPVAVASHGYWRRRFGRDAATLNRVIRISGAPITIIGVAPPGFFGEQVGQAPDLWIPLTMWGQIVPGRNPLLNAGTGWLRLIGRIRPGVAVSGVHPELTGLFRQVVAEIFGPTMPEDVRRDTAAATIALEPAGRGLSNLRAQFARPLELLMGAVVLVLLIACANIANLLLTRATARRREFDIRVALGMSRVQLVRQLLTESFVLAGCGGALGVAIAWWGREALLRLTSADGSRLPLAAEIDLRLLVFVAATSSATAILFGLAPAWQSSRASLRPSLTARREAGNPRQRLGSLLVAGQVALSLVLVMGAGLFLRTIANLRDVDLGFTPERLLVVDVNPQAAGYRGDRAIALVRRLLDRIQSLPGVSSISLSEHGVLEDGHNGTNLMRPEGFAGGPEGYPQIRWDVVGPRYFSTLGTPLLAGRDFTGRDAVGSPHVVAINEEMAGRFFAGVDPIGRRLVWGVGERAKVFEIVAVTRDVKQRSPRDDPQMRFYLPYFQLPEVRSGWTLNSVRFLVRTPADPMALAPLLREQIPAEDPRLSVARLEMGTALVTRSLVQERMIATLLVVFGVLAIGLACLGLYGLIAYQVAQRASEIGIRMALGARRASVLWAMLQRAIVWIALGLAAGIPLALTVSRVARNLLFGLGPADAGTLAGSAILLAAMGLLAGYLPARRAAKVDPLAALRCE
jgi:predicted permease